MGGSSSRRKFMVATCVFFFAIVAFKVFNNSAYLDNFEEYSNRIEDEAHIVHSIMDDGDDDDDDNDDELRDDDDGDDDGDVPDNSQRYVNDNDENDKNENGNIPAKIDNQEETNLIVKTDSSTENKSENEQKDGKSSTISDENNATSIGQSDDKDDENDNDDDNIDEEINSDIVIPIWNQTTWEFILKKYRDSPSSSPQKVRLPRTNYTEFDIYPEIQGDGQLVLNLPDHTLLFFPWGRGLDYSINNLYTMMHDMSMIDDTKRPLSSDYDIIVLPSRPLVNVTVDCEHLKQTSGLGEGNWVTSVYTMRLVAAAARVDWNFQCVDSDDIRMERILPWVSSYQSTPDVTKPWPYQGHEPTSQELRGWPSRVDFMIDGIMDDMQKMAVTIMGSLPEMNRTHPSVPVDQPALIPGIEMEDVVIHFRCGDVFGGASRHDFGMIKFTEYAHWISNDTATIGIVTQPFDKGRNRREDMGRTEPCRLATYRLVDTIQSSFPSAKIAIHNEELDTLPLTWARLAMAKQSFTTLSSFGIFPVIGGFGKSYFQRGQKSVNWFTNTLPDIYPDKMHMMTAPFLSSWNIEKQIKLHGVNGTLDWFTDENKELSWESTLN